MHLGLDVHGVIDQNLSYWKSLAQLIRKLGGEVTIITGESISPKLLAELGDEVFWDHLVSIQDELSKTLEPEGYNEFGRPLFPAEAWDGFKGKYCDEHGVTMHVDDTARYGKYFHKTRFILCDPKSL